MAPHHFRLPLMSETLTRPDLQGLPVLHGCVYNLLAKAQKFTAQTVALTWHVTPLVTHFCHRMDLLTPIIFTIILFPEPIEINLL